MYDSKNTWADCCANTVSEKKPLLNAHEHKKNHPEECTCSSGSLQQIWFQSPSYCKGELLVGIIIRESILLIKGSADRSEKTSQRM